MFTPSIEAAIQAHAVACYPEECCGIVHLDGRGDPVFRPTKNTHPEPRLSFRIDGRIVAPLLRDRRLQAVVHSHVNGLYYPSQQDMESQIGLGVTFGLVLTDGENASPVLWWGDDVPKAPLVGRTFIPGVQDCYAIIRHYYQQELGIYLRDYPRTDHWWDVAGATSLYLDFVEREDFVQVHDPRTHDLQFMKIMSPVVNHAAVLIGQDKILHHAGGRLSHDEDSASKWLKQTHSWWRHKSLL